MNNPFDGNSALSDDSQLDGLIHQLGLDSHQHSNLPSSESAVDLHNLSQHLDSASNSVHSGSETEQMARLRFGGWRDPETRFFQKTGFLSPKQCTNSQKSVLFVDKYVLAFSSLNRNNLPAR